MRGIPVYRQVELRGVAEPATTLQNAIDTCQSEGGGRVQIGAGEAYLSQAVIVRPGAAVVLAGEGRSTVLAVDGSHFALSLEGSYIDVRDLCLASRGGWPGGISLYRASTNISISDVWWGSGFSMGLYAAPVGPGTVGIYRFERLRWDAVNQTGTAIQIGNGVQHVSDVSLTQVSGTAIAQNGITSWLMIARDTDTIQLDHVTFYGGEHGIQAGAGTDPAKTITGLSITQSVLENFATEGLAIVKAQDVRLHNVEMAQSQRAIWLGPGVRGASIQQCTLQAHRGTAVDVSGARMVDIAHCLIQDNNSENGPYGFGVSLAGAREFSITDNMIGNGLWGGGGYQKVGIMVDANCRDYVLSGNRGTNQQSLISDWGRPNG